MTLDQWKARARALQAETYALYLAYRDPRTPWHARLAAGAVAAYAFSPIDLIPDFIPVFGYLDDLLLVPLGVALALRLIPAEVMADARQQARAQIASGEPVARGAAVVIVALWALSLAAAVWLGVKLLR